MRAPFASKSCVWEFLTSSLPKALQCWCKFKTKCSVPEHHHNGRFAAGHNHQPFPDHQSWRHDHTKVQHLVIQLKQRKLQKFSDDNTAEAGNKKKKRSVHADRAETNKSCKVKYLILYNDNTGQLKHKKALKYSTWWYSWNRQKLPSSALGIIQPKQTNNEFVQPTHVHTVQVLWLSHD